jgi:OOP family OmpA-OmpF porin
MLKFVLRSIPTAPQRSALFVLSLATASVFSLVTGCTTKNYVRNQTTPVINGTNELDDKTAANNRALQDLDKRTGQGIQNAQQSANSAQQAAMAANGSAGTAQGNAQDAVHRAATLGSVVQNLDTYKQLDSISVTFAFNKSVLTARDKAMLDGLGAQLGGQRSFILSLTGGTDSVGSAAYNYQLSDQRANAVVQYLASKYGVPAHRFYLIGLGEDQEVATNSTASGRAKNRRVTVQLMTNQPMDANAASGMAATQPSATAPTTNSTAGSAPPQ